MSAEMMSNGAQSTPSNVAGVSLTVTSQELAATATLQEESQSAPTLVETSEPTSATLPEVQEPTATETPSAIETPLPDLTATAIAMQASIETAVAATAQVRFLELTQTAEADEATATAAATRRATSTAVPQRPTSTPVPLPTQTATATPKPALPECVSSPGTQFKSFILRDRPWNTYNQIATVARGESALILETFQNEQGQWFHIRYNGQEGWVKQDICQAVGNIGDVPVANSATVPGSLPTPTLPPSTNTPLPQPTALPPTPIQPATAIPQTLFFRGQLMGCIATSSGTFFEGMVYVNGQPADGYRIVFRSSKGSGPATAPVISGIGHNFTAKGDLNWPPGYYKHVIQGSVQSPAKTWVVWIIDEKGKAISDELFWTADGPGTGCNYATVNFYSGN